MEKIPFHFSPTVPGSVDLYRWDWHGRIIKDLTLSSAEADRLRVAQMTLNVSKVAIIAEDGGEHFILNFQGNNKVTLNGIGSGKSMRTKRISHLPLGHYTKMRFYIKEEASYLSDIREERRINGLTPVEFEFDNALEISGGESPEFVLRFNFVPFKSKSIADYFKNWRFFQRPKAKWTF